MKELKVATLMLLILMWNTEVDSASFTCQFKTESFEGEVELMYSCYVQNVNDLVGASVKIEGATGDPEPGKDKSMVQFLNIDSAKGLTRFPTNVDAIFPKLTGIQLLKSGLTEIAQNDLKVFPDLKILILNQSKLKIIHADTFLGNPKLKWIIIEANQIIHIDKLTFTHLKNLTTLYLSGNICPYLDSRDTRPEVVTLIQRIDDGICQSFEYLIKNLQNEIQLLTKGINEFEIKPEICAEKMNETSKNDEMTLQEISKLSLAIDKINKDASGNTKWDKISQLLSK